MRQAGRQAGGQADTYMMRQSAPAWHSAEANVSSDGLNCDIMHAGRVSLHRWRFPGSNLWLEGLALSGTAIPLQPFEQWPPVVRLPLLLVLAAA